ncbi:MAG: VOC family protein [Clostridia bacterium]|nr:VOC family protein [Clostridia bacterium]
MITGIEHIAVCAKDTLALKDWYVKMFDFKVVYDNGKGTYFVAAPDGSMIEIIAADKDLGKNEPADSGVRHFALSVTEDGFEKMVRKLKAEGVEIVTDVKEKNGIKTFFFRDIEGNIFHLIYRPQPLV